MSEKIKKALKIAVNVGCGFEGDAEDAASLLGLIETNEARIAELKVFIDQLIEAGDDVALVAKDIFEFDGKSGEFMPIAEKWQALVKDWKEG